MMAAGEACGLLAPNVRPPDDAVVAFVLGAEEVEPKLAKGFPAA